MLRCPYCHDDVRAGQDWKACAACLARHHSPCWNESGRCGTCRGEVALSPSALRLDAIVKPLRRHGGAVLVSSLLGLALGSVVGFAFLRPPAPVPAAPAPAPGAPPGDVPPPPTTYEISRPRAVAAKPEGPAPVAAAPAPAADAEDEEVVTKLPAAVEDACVAGGGRYLVLKMQGMDAVAVYDSDEKRLAKILKLPSSDFVFAAGGQTFVAYFKENNLLQVWDLATFEKKRAKPNPLPGLIVRMVMGHSRDDVAFVRYAESTDSLARAGQFLLQTATLTAAGGDRQGVTGHNSSYRDFVHFRADKDLSHITEWASSHSPSGLGIYRRTGKGYETKYEHTSDGVLCMGDDGRVYSSGGTIYSSDLHAIGRVDGKRLIPGLGGALYLAVSGDGKLTVYPSGRTTPIGACGSIPRFRDLDERWTQSTYALDKRIVFMPARGRLLYIPVENDRVVCRRFDLRAQLEKAGVDYLVVTSTPDGRAREGQEWQYQLRVLSKAGDARFEVELGPDGMRVSPAGLVTWRVPQGFAKPEKVVLLVSDKAGEQTYHTFTIQPDAR